VGPRKAEEPITRISVFVKKEQLAALRAINEQTGIPVSVLIRTGVDRVIAEHRSTTRRAKR